jgi:RNA polymerase sigma factor (sigma-70 family)
VIAVDEKHLIKQLADSVTQRSAFSLVVKQYSESLYWQIRRIVLNHEDANDVLQNTFIKAWNNLETFRNDSKLSTWLFRIAINESLDFIRKQKNEISIERDTDVVRSVSDTLMADEYFDGNELQAQLMQAVSELPETQQIVFNMKYFDGMKYSEISKVLSTSEGALKASFHIAVQKISKFFQSRD